MPDGESRREIVKTRRRKLREPNRRGMLFPAFEWHCHSHPGAPRHRNRGAMFARIYKPVKTAVQPGLAKTQERLLDYEPATWHSPKNFG
jgi:hypothetical protein